MDIWETQKKKQLAVLSVEIAAAKRNTKEELQVLIPVLAQDLREYRPEHTQEAIRRHRDKSPFWPAISDLKPYLNEIAHEEWLEMNETEQKNRVNEMREIRGFLK